MWEEVPTKKWICIFECSGGKKRSASGPKEVKEEGEVRFVHTTMEKNNYRQYPHTLERRSIKKKDRGGNVKGEDS